jgi:hypothetical protein
MSLLRHSASGLWTGLRHKRSYEHVCAMYGSDVLCANLSIKRKRCDVVITCAASRLRKFELVM